MPASASISFRSKTAVRPLSRDAVLVELRRTQQFAQSALNALHRHLCIVDADGDVVECSEGWPSYAEATGADPRALFRGASYFRVAERARGPHAASLRELAAGVRAVLAGELGEFSMEVGYDCLATPRWFHSRVSRFVVDGAAYAAISHEDITERVRSEQELRNLRAQQWHGERVTRTGLLIASLAHELSQPLAAILSNAQAGLRFLALEDPDLGEIRAILRDVVADDKRAGEIIDSLRLMLRRQKTDRDVIDIGDVAREVGALLRGELVQKQVGFALEDGRGCLALADRAQIQQVLLNLMMNAIEAMQPKAPAGRTLRVAVRDTGAGEVQVSVRDSGVGITQEQFSKIFDAFWTTKSRGTGMGLAIARSIIESHGGRITVQSRVGEGATFVVSLPAAAPPRRGAATAERMPARAPARA
jgi:signal transduction histidine kinase